MGQILGIQILGIQVQTRSQFRILNSAEAEKQLWENNELDNYDTACARCRVNRLAAQRIEPCAAPEGLKKAIMDIQLPKWLEVDLASTDVKVAFFKEGLPHTRAGDTIWLPVSMSNFETTFIHECVHISQRLWPQRWTAAYKAVWNMTPTEMPSIPHRRFNPDTFNSPVFKWTAPSGATWTPVLVFMNPDAPKLSSVRLLFVNERNGWQSTPPQEWISVWGTGDPSIYEHPHEMAAYQIAGANLKNKELLIYLERNSSS
jgi:hypothetical protein